jgi:SAM-dependent methyltransferase
VSPDLNATAFEHMPCPYCGQMEAEHYADLEDWLCGLPGQFTLVRCTECGLIRQNPRPTEETIGAYYPSDYKPFLDSRVSARSASVRSWLLAYGLRRRTRFVLRHQPQGRLLDVGCATGLFLDAVRSLGQWHVQGVELSPDEAAFGREHFGLEIATGSFSHFAARPGTFDVITMWDVLEHLHDPVFALEKASHLLRPQGILVLRVPHLESIEARCFGRYWAGLDAPRHLFVFPRRVLEHMLQKVGLAVVDRQCWGGYHLFALSVRFWLAAHRGSRLPRQLVERLLASLPARALTYPWFAFLDGALGRGPAIAVVARKQGHR